MDLDEIRNKLTEIDLQIIENLSQRISLVPSLVEYKKDHKISIFQPEREKQMHNKYWRLAAEKRINPELVRKIFELIIAEMTKLQNGLINNE